MVAVDILHKLATGYEVILSREFPANFDDEYTRELYRKWVSQEQPSEEEIERILNILAVRIKDMHHLPGLSDFKTILKDIRESQGNTNRTAGKKQCSVCCDGLISSLFHGRKNGLMYLGVTPCTCDYGEAKYGNLGVYFSISSFERQSFRETAARKQREEGINAGKYPAYLEEIAHRFNRKKLNQIQAEEAKQKKKKSTPVIPKPEPVEAQKIGEVDLPIFDKPTDDEMIPF